MFVYRKQSFLSSPIRHLTSCNVNSVFPFSFSYHVHLLPKNTKAKPKKKFLQPYLLPE